jgi:AraC-like DNA-binding protein
MKISVTDRHRSGIVQEFARAIGATVNGRFYHIPKDKGEGYITGFAWEDDELRMLIRNYYLTEEIELERTNEFIDGQDDVIFLLSGIIPSTAEKVSHTATEVPSVLICRQEVTSILSMPPDTFFRSIAIAVSRPYLKKLFREVTHPVILSILQSKEQFAFETGITPDMIKTASEIVHPAVQEALENQYCRLKCEELLCHVLNLLMQREAVPTGTMHINDIKTIYTIKARLQSQLNVPPDIASLAIEAGMSAPKLRKLFRQTFGKGVFEYFQHARMQEAAHLLKDKRLSVSEVGYSIGFTNLSHFSRVFEQHMGIKPKKYSAQI